jgi:hypothetical protein
MESYIQFATTFPNPWIDFGIVTIIYLVYCSATGKKPFME